jgi:hypothetical protein
MNKPIALVVGTVGLVVFLAAGVAFAMVKTGYQCPRQHHRHQQSRQHSR